MQLPEVSMTRLLVENPDLRMLAGYVHRGDQLEEYTTAQLEDATHPVNKKKYQGKDVLNTTTGRVVTCSGNTITSSWDDRSNNVLHTVT